MISPGSVLLAGLLLALSSGLQIVLLPVRAEMAGFSGLGIGLLGGAHYLEFLTGSLCLPRAIRRIGRVRSYGAAAAIEQVAVLAHPPVDPAWWYGLRVLLGFSVAGLVLVIESWLNGATGSERRGRLLGLYMAVTWTGLIGGIGLLPATRLAGFEPFAVSTLAMALPALPITLTRSVPRRCRPVPPLPRGWPVRHPSACWAASAPGSRRGRSGHSPQSSRFPPGQIRRR